MSGGTMTASDSTGREPMTSLGMQCDIAVNSAGHFRRCDADAGTPLRHGRDGRPFGIAPSSYCAGAADVRCTKSGRRLCAGARDAAEAGGNFEFVLVVALVLVVELGHRLLRNLELQSQRVSASSAQEHVAADRGEYDRRLGVKAHHDI